MTAALRAARERGDLGSALYPFRVSFYQKLGYGQAGEAHQFLVPPSQLPDSPERFRVELLENDEQRAEARAFYNEWARTQTGQLARNERLWKHICEQQSRALVGYRGKNESLEGYALVVYRADLPRTQRYLEVDEITWTTDDARRGLYGWLASLGDQWEQILLRALPSHRLADWIREPRLPHAAAPPWGLWAPGATLMMGSMFRLLDMHKAWEKRRVADGSRLAIALEVADEQIGENHGSWRLVLSGGSVSVEPKGSAELSLRLNVSTLSRLYVAALSPREALQAGLLECDRPDLLDRLGAALALPEPWTFDRF
jgi:predicted acetyltransferase